MDLLRAAASPVAAVILAVGAIVVSFLLRTWWPHKHAMLRMKRLGKPMPDWNPVLGSLLAAGKAFQGIPPGAHSCYMMHALSKKFPNGAFYIDTWPMADPMLVVVDPDMATQAVYHPRSGARKPPMLQGWFYPITGGPSLFDSNGREWKTLHDIFLPGFSNSNISNEVPVIVDRIVIYRDILRGKAKAGDLFPLEPLLLRLITDIIGEILLNIKLDSQRQSHPLADTMVRQLQLKFVSYKPENILALVNPFLKHRARENSRILDGNIKAQLEKRFEALKAEMDSGKEEGFKSVMDLAILDYLSQPGKRNAATLDSDFLTMATRNMRMFFFAGYDSSAGTVAYCYYAIFRDPDILARVRAEHDAVFGKDIDATPGQIASNPALLNSLPYTQAVIKETMRLFPMANGIRDGSPDLEIVDPEGNRYPTEGFAVLVSHYAVHRNPKYWRRAEEFLPERWLVEPGHELYPPKGGWRAFEYGPRLCIGQPLVMTEVKAILACTVREFDIRVCYDEVDGGRQLDLSKVAGERAYMTEMGAAHPVGRLPCRVSLSGYVPGST
ncbi:Cytochrome p450 71b25 [Pleurostoma richardsiae]|uniref:Cytochrome p450 71b25 n=1 Tax=Pleurostoma richardsiae TaxID=41990 RepID=A0AA38S3K0_9PEZI|nr:Cytochrome p450 71b25 [Pleurostoma richardsiae]